MKKILLIHNILALQSLFSYNSKTGSDESTFLEIIDLILHVFREHLLLAGTLALFVIGFLFYIFKTAAFLAFASQIPGYSAFAKLFGAINRRFKLSVFDRVRDGILRRRKRLKEEKEEKKRKKQQQKEDPDKELNDALRAEQQQKQMEREGRQIPLPDLAPLERREQVRQEISAERLAEQRRDVAKLVQEAIAVKASTERQEERRVQLDERRHTTAEISPSLFVGMKVPELIYNELSHSRQHSHHHHLPQSLLSMLNISTPLQSLDLIAKAAIVAHAVATHHSGQQHSGSKPEKAPSEAPKVTLAQTSLSNPNATQNVDKPKTHIPDFVKNFQAKADVPAHNR